MVVALLTRVWVRVRMQPYSGIYILHIFLIHLTWWNEWKESNSILYFVLFVYFLLFLSNVWHYEMPNSMWNLLSCVMFRSGSVAHSPELRLDAHAKLGSIYVYILPYHRQWMRIECYLFWDVRNARYRYALFVVCFWVLIFAFCGCCWCYCAWHRQASDTDT